MNTTAWTQYYLDLQITQYLKPILWQSLGGLMLVNCILQVMFFSASVISIVTFFFRLINFSYADQVMKFPFAKWILFAFFLYCKIHEAWSDNLWYISMCAACFICLYLYDACCNCVDSYHLWRISKIAAAEVFGIILVLTIAFQFGIIFYLSKYYSDQFDNKILIFFVIVLVCTVIINLLRRRSLYYGLVILALMGSISLMRFYVQQWTKDTIWGFLKLPLEVLPYLLLAIDAEGKQYKKNKAAEAEAEVSHELFKACAYFLAYSMLNYRNFYIEICFGVISVMMFILNK